MFYNSNSSKPHALLAAEISRRLGGYGAVSSDGWSRAPCPAHRSRSTDSLSMKLTAPGRLTVKCWSRRCSSEEILQAIDARLGTSFSYGLDAATDFADAPAAVSIRNSAEAGR
jgi:hypothetical protein